MSTAADHVPTAAVLESIADAVIVADREGVIRLWNEGSSVVFGFTADEALGQSLDLIIPEKRMAERAKRS